MLFLHMFARSAMPGTSSAKCSAQEAVTPTAAGELSTRWSSRTKKINANRIVEPHVNCILVVPNWLNEYIFMMILAIMATAYDSVWLYDSFHYRLIRYLTPGFQGESSPVLFMLFLHILATSAMSGASSGQCSTATAALPTRWSSSRKQNKTSWKADWCTSFEGL